MSLETMIESATRSTITIAVAADRPPMKTPRLSRGALPSIGSASTYMSLSTAPKGKITRPASAIGITNTLMATRYSGNSQRAAADSKMDKNSPPR